MPWSGWVWHYVECDDQSFTSAPEVVLPCCSFDLIFLDANKDGYQAYYDIIMSQQLLAPSGLLVVDNTLMKVGNIQGWPLT